MQDLNFPFTNIARGWIASKASQKEVVGEFDDYFAMLARIQTNVTEILSTARKKGIKVIYSCLGYHDSQLPSPFQIAIGGDWNLEGIAGTHIPQWEPKSTEIVFSKPGWGASSNPYFMEYIASKKIQNVFILGSMFGLGVRQSSIEMADKGLAVLIASDAVTDVSYGELHAGLLGIAHGLIKVRSSGEVVDIIKRMNDAEEVVV
jgi:nicotinamidase-related amidase